MSPLIEKWSREHIRRLFTGGLSPGERARLANGLDPFPPVSTPLVLVLRAPEVCTESVKELVFHYADINFFGLDGSNPLSEVLSRWIAGGNGAVELLELVLRLGANPSVSLIVGDRVLTPIDFVLEHSARNDAAKILVLLLAFGGSFTGSDHPLISLRADAVDEAMLWEHPILATLVRRLWNLPKSLDAAEILRRHRFLGHTMVRPLVPAATARLGREDAIHVNPLFEDRGYDGEDGFVSEGRFHYSVDMIPHVLATGKNPLTGVPLPDEIRREWYGRLLGNDPPVPTRSFTDVVTRWPVLWPGEPTGSPSFLWAVCDRLRSFLEPVHPYTQVMSVPGWSATKQAYLLDLADAESTIEDFFRGILTAVSVVDTADTVLTSLHFLVENTAGDYVLYEELNAVFAAAGEGFVFYFLDAILVPGVLDVMLRHAETRSFLELSRTWFRVCDVYFHEEGLDEQTTPSLFTDVS